MRRNIEVTSSVRASIDSVRESVSADPGLFVAAGPGPRRLRLHTTASDGTGVSQTVTASIGRPHDTFDGLAVPVSWTPATHKRLIPSFAGELRLAPGRDGWTNLTLSGSYAPPLGIAGRLGDRLWGHRLARRSLTGLINAMADRLQAAVLRNPTRSRSHPAPYPADLRER